MTATRGAPQRRRLGPDQLDALTAAMILAPGVYGRNRMFDLFSCAGARRARARAAAVRGLVPELARAASVSLASAQRGFTASFVLRYAIPRLRLTRAIELSPVELASLRLLAERAGVRAVPAEPADKEVVARSLAHLVELDASLAGAGPTGGAVSPAST